MIEFLKHLVSVFVLVNTTSRFFEKPDNANLRTLKEPGILLHVYIISWFLIAADYLHRCGDRDRLTLVKLEDVFNISSRSFLPLVAIR